MCTAYAAAMDVLSKRLRLIITAAPLRGQASVQIRRSAPCLPVVWDSNYFETNVLSAATPKSEPP